MSDEHHVPILIPAYNEAEHISDVVTHCLKWSPNIWVVCDHCTDDTAILAEQAGAHTLHHQGKTGKAAALRTGWNHLISKKDWNHLIIMDGDGQHSPEDIPQFLETVRGSESDLIIGNRSPFLPPMPLARRWTNRIMSAITSTMAGKQIPDSQCGFRMLSRKLIESNVWRSSRYEIETEMIFRADFIETVPVRTIYAQEESHIQPTKDTLRWLHFLLSAKQS